MANRSRTAYRRYKEKIFATGRTIRCNLCGIQLTLDTATVDHVKPLGLGGENDTDNYRLLCKDCNQELNQLTQGPMQCTKCNKDIEEGMWNGVGYQCIKCGDRNRYEPIVDAMIVIQNHAYIIGPLRARKARIQMNDGSVIITERLVLLGPTGRKSNGRFLTHVSKVY